MSSRRPALMGQSLCMSRVRESGEMMGGFGIEGKQVPYLLVITSG
jgi:hypothetical protein